jgi:hypothetical protein
VAWAITELEPTHQNGAKYLVEAVAQTRPSSAPGDQYVLNPDGCVTSSCGMKWADKNQWMAWVREKNEAKFSV